MARSYRTPGTKPQPTFLKLIKGTPKRLLNKAEPQAPIVTDLPVPAHLNGEAKTEWLRVVPIMARMGILSGCDRGVLSAYCQSWGRWVDAEVMLIEYANRGAAFKGYVVTTKGGNVINNPMLGIANKAKADMVRYATDLGLTPSARSRLQVNEAQDALDPAAKYFR